MRALLKGKMGACRSCVVLTGSWSKRWLRSRGACGLTAEGCEYFQVLGELQLWGNVVLEVETSWCYWCLT